MRTKIKKDEKWFSEYLGIELISRQTRIEDLIYLLAKKVEKLEKKK